MFLPVRQNGRLKMKDNRYLINVILSVVTLLVCIAGVITRSFFPYIILPRMDVLMMVAICTFSCAIAFYVNSGNKAEMIGASLLAGLNFSVLPMCAGLTFGTPVWKLFLAGAVVFFVMNLCYEAIGRRMTTGKCNPLAPLANAFLLFLACQCFQQIFF